MKKDLRKVILKYLELCHYFKNSKMWGDEEGIILYETDTNADGQDYPILYLYKPIAEASKLYGKIKDTEDFTEFIPRIKSIADKTWYALNCRSDVLSSTENLTIEVPDATKNPILSYFLRPLNTTINRDFLESISCEIWQELGGDN